MYFAHLIGYSHYPPPNSYSFHFDQIALFLFLLCCFSFPQEGWTALHKAAKKGHSTAVQTLIQSGADLEAQATGYVGYQLTASVELTE